MIQEYYYSFGKKSLLMDKINQESCKINLKNQPLDLEYIEDSEEEKTYLQLVVSYVLSNLR